MQLFKKAAVLMALLLVLAVSFSPFHGASAQVPVRQGIARPAAMKMLDKVRGLNRVLENLDPRVGQVYSTPEEKFFALKAAAEGLQKAVGERGLEASSQLGQAIRNGSVGGAIAGGLPSPKGLANNPLAPEDALSRLSGRTQSETSVAWFGNNVVVGFNDSGSAVATLAGLSSPSGSLSFVGYATSSDGGATFVDRGALVADPLPSGLLSRILLGDPVVRAADENTFYFASLAIDLKAQTLDDGSRRFFSESGISVSKSANGGASFGGAVITVSQPEFLSTDTRFESHFLDKPWMAVSGTTVHVTYTHFGFIVDFEIVGDRFIFKGFEDFADIEYVRSSDGGLTWTSPQKIERAGGFSDFAQASQATAGIDNDVYVAWERFSGTGREIRIRKSSDGGVTFTPPATVSFIGSVGTGFLTQGGFRNFLDFQGIAVDKSSAATRGNVYAVWQDGRNEVQIDSLFLQSYRFGDILLSRSTDGGVTWQPAVRVNDDLTTRLVDQFMPALEVTPRGEVRVLFYDRRGDPQNLKIDVFMANSSDGGLTFRNERITLQSFPVTIGQDFLINPSYMGDYNAIAADGSGRSSGVIMAWGDNSLGDPNVRVEKR